MSRSRTSIIGSLLALVAALAGVVVIGYLLSTRFLEPMTWSTLLLLFVPIVAAQVMLNLAKKNDPAGGALSRILPLVDRFRRTAKWINEIVLGFCVIVVGITLFSFLSLKGAVILFGYQPGFTDQDVGSATMAAFQIVLGAGNFSLALQAIYGRDFE